nr:alpha/beta fold hydrolase [Trinickia acidisoli]
MDVDPQRWAFQERAAEVRWFSDARGFSPLERALDRDQFTYICMDYRGYGDMQAVAGEYTIDEIANDALALADALGFETFSLIGHSMGGMVIERIAMLAPRRVRMLIPVAPLCSRRKATLRNTSLFLPDALNMIAKPVRLLLRPTKQSRSIVHSEKESSWKTANPPSCSCTAH